MVALGERIACLTVDVEPDLRCPEQRIRLLDEDARMQALAELLRAYDVPLTMFVVTSHARRYAERLNALARALPAAEFALHSHTHDTRHPCSKEEIESAVDAYGELWNSKPAGYRAPNCLIDDEGMERLIRAGFLYDSSIVPSVRMDAHRYNHLRMPREPFRFSSPSGELLELPIACFGGIRLPLAFSYIKLLGFGAYRAAAAAFSLPNTVVTYFHFYDLYAGEIAHNIRGWKRYAHSRNGRNGLRLLRDVIAFLKQHGYRFALMRDCAQSRSREQLPTQRLFSELAAS